MWVFSRALFLTQKQKDEEMEALLKEGAYGGLTILGTYGTALALKMVGANTAVGSNPLLAAVTAPVASYVACRAYSNFLYYINDY